MFPDSNIPVIGLTGPSGTGKTTAARLLADLGCFIIDGDVLAREITRPGSPALAALAERFGEDILDACGALNRSLLAHRAFRCEAGRLALNRITHPHITDLALERAAEAPPGTRAIVLDAAALPESELARFCDIVILMEAPEDLRLRRIIARDGIAEAAARQRIVAQRSIAYVPAGGTGHTILKSDESEAALQHELCKIMERFA